MNREKAYRLLKNWLSDDFILIAVLGYALAIGGTEIVLVYHDIIAGFIGHIFLILILLTHYAVARQGADWRILPVLALIPLLRVYSLSMAIQEIPVLYWYVTAGIPLLISVFLTKRLLGISYAELGLLIPASWKLQLSIGLSGIPLSWVAFRLLKPDLIVEQLRVGNAIAGVVILTVFAGFAEEIIFRGLLQLLGNKLFERRGFLFTNGLFAIMYLGSLAPGYAIFMGLIGVFWGWCVEQTRSLWGVILAHSLLSVGLLLIWPA